MDPDVVRIRRVYRGPKLNHIGRELKALTTVEINKPLANIELNQGLRAV
jgi:hypothetical protein